MRLAAVARAGGQARRRQPRQISRKQVGFPPLVVGAVLGAHGRAHAICQPKITEGLRRQQLSAGADQRAFRPLVLAIQRQGRQDAPAIVAGPDPVADIAMPVDDSPAPASCARTSAGRWPYVLRGRATSRRSGALGKFGIIAQHGHTHFVGARGFGIEAAADPPGEGNAAAALAVHHAAVRSYVCSNRPWCGNRRSPTRHAGPVFRDSPGSARLRSRRRKSA